MYMDPVSQELLKKKHSTKKNTRIIIISSKISIRTGDAFGSGMVQKRLFVPHIKIEIKKTQRKRSPWGGDPPLLSN